MWTWFLNKKRGRNDLFLNLAPLSEFEQRNDKTNTIPHAIEPNDSKCFKIKVMF